MFEWLSDPSAWLSLATLTLLEIILGIDNIIFLSLVVAKLPERKQNFARRLGLGGAMLMRISLLASLAWVVKLQNPLFYIYQYYFSFTSPETLAQHGDLTPLLLAVSARDLVLFLGGLFLIWKGTLEIKEMFNPPESHTESSTHMTLTKAIIQIMVLDIVFSLDSVITAVGLSEHLMIMILAVVIAVGIMMFAAKPIGDFVNTYPTVKMLALAFLILVGWVLMIESFHAHVPKGYIYFALFFSLGVEILNLLRNRRVVSFDLGPTSVEDEEENQDDKKE
ncbi:TerC family protein [Zophobihabitans entericus]|uniref:TerC family protein n=1 Tax=Zophobihabitans entericus TaxID=1635327 RepID=A0A6G9I7W9_9GAMM|nr:TerC family protein [Zophobihabitans entericus]QIQ20301.1 TerC family protein [Zophobihabitans entericus]